MRLQEKDPARKVLVVDDDADWRGFLRTSLEELGYETHEASDGPGALELLKRERFGVVLLDLLMPGMSGEDVVARLPAGAPRVVFLTGAPVQDVGPALASGAHYYLPKGANREQLELMLHSLEQ
ncbi:MAG: response regulator [Myxococcaceae bacterium]|nr:response regulator [Myxococcaceae bacterium]MCI0672988.1 response regulator [Myxococcaceae bacterium]